MSRLPADDAIPEDDDALGQGLRASRTLTPPPPAVLARALAVWAPRPAGALSRAAGGAMRWLRAVLQHDSGLVPPQALGLRSSAGGLRQMLFSVQGHDIDLRVMPLDGTLPLQCRIDGQVLGPSSDGRAILTCGAWHAESAWNELCEFRFSAVPAGTCQLLLRGDDWVIEIGPIDLPAGG